jgi:cytidine deaminase
MSSEIPWQLLKERAIEIMAKAYAPYSKFKVGVAGLVDDGRIVTGCAECGMVSDLHATGGGKLVAVVCVDADGNPLQPCGRCRQLLFEFGGNELLIQTPNGPQNLGSLLPWAFGPRDLR